ncbi:citryl-CoA lyase [Pseudomonas lopnurensis]|uniref:citryl-CoA lyase n=1 Tax=Pseudomonas lopnurensis TaxID=1477517 RepID=UPI0028B0F699|nr:citryl-CoA lyase [Pseudomonas lopnurensis]
MTDKPQTQQMAEDWWSTEIIDMQPGVIRYRGYAIERLIGNIGFSQMIWLMLRGELPSPEQAELLEAALMAAVDHGPQAPSIAVARMAATCGVGLNGALASAVNTLGDVHGGAGEQAVGLYGLIASKLAAGTALPQAVDQSLDAFTKEQGKYVPGFGHRFHPIDPRTAPLLALADRARADGIISGEFATIARAVEARLAVRKGKRIPLNIDGATAVIYAELGFPAPLARGLFCLSRSVGILAHAWEQTQQGGRNKGPIPRQFIWTYSGVAPRDLQEAE